jgi:hypothetical protein
MTADAMRAKAALVLGAGGTRLARFACRADELLRNPPAGSPAGANPKTSIKMLLKPR